MQDDTGIGWSDADVRLPWEIRFLVSYLLAVSIITVVKSVIWAQQLGLFSNSKRTLLSASNDEDTKANLLAASALANRVPGEISKAIHESSLAGDMSQVLTKAEHHFLYKWEIFCVEINSLCKLSNLTYLLSLSVLLYRIMTILEKVSIQKALSAGAAAGGLMQALMPFAMGVFVCAVLYAVWSFYGSVLERRRAAWQYFCAKTREGESHR